MGRTPTPTTTNEPAQLAMVLAHVRKHVEEVNGPGLGGEGLRELLKGPVVKGGLITFVEFIGCDGEEEEED